MKDLHLTLKVWRQAGPSAKGQFVTYEMDNVNEHMSFLEMLDVLNERLVGQQEEPIVFEHDCREGICGTCSLVINGHPHGHMHRTSACQLHMRNFNDGDTITIEPFRAKAFPMLKDLSVDRSALDRVIQAGGFISINTGQAQDANAIPIEKTQSSSAMDAAECIGCGGCVAACPNASAMLFVSAKVSHLAQLPQGKVEAKRRAQRMVAAMDDEGFGMCSNITACEAECPKGISVSNIARLNREYLTAALTATAE